MHSIAATNSSNLASELQIMQMVLDYNKILDSLENMLMFHEGRFDIMMFKN